MFPGAREDRPYPRTKGMKTASKLSRSEPSIRNRRPPPAAPVRISAANFAKRSQEQRTQSMIGSARLVSTHVHCTCTYTKCTVNIIPSTCTYS